MVDCFRKTLQWEGVPGLYKVRLGAFIMLSIELAKVVPAEPQQQHQSACAQGVTSPLAGQMVFRASLFSAFGASKRWLATNPDGTTRELTTPDFFKVGCCARWPDSVTMTNQASQA